MYEVRLISLVHYFYYRCLARYLLHMHKTEIYVVMSSSASEE